MTPITRKENYLNEIVGWGETAPEKPLTPEEFFFAAILGEAVQTPEPLSRYQIYLAKIAGRNISVPKPLTRLELFLAKACGMNIETPTPITREEIFWSNYSAIVDFEVEGVPPLTYKAIEGTLENYRIFGNTVGGESVGDLVESGEHEGEYSVPVTVEGKNLWDGEIESGSWMGFNADDEPYKVDYDIRCRSSKLIAVKNSTVYTISNHEPSTNVQVIVQYRDNNKKFINEYGWADFPCTFTTPSNAAFIEFIIRKPSNLKIMPEDCGDIQLELGSTALPYEPYHTPVTTNIYLPEQIRKVGDEAEYIDYVEQKQHRVRKNLLQNTATSQTINGVTFTVNADGSITCSGILTSGEYADLVVSGVFLGNTDILENGNYVVSCANGSKDAYLLVGNGKGEVGRVRAAEINISTNLTWAMLRIRQADPAITLYPMIRKADISDDTYEPYIENTDLDVTLPALPTIKGTNVLSVGTAVQPSKVYVKYKGERQ